ncbi:MAG: hypothetical protein KZQ58_03300 [gamma proteobacterium symbiont of Bathyaustriella thionipta]|nr:hypothetical protein [gamma proteobacterium symbiont of Bathyaustriella thionipta]
MNWRLFVAILMLAGASAAYANIAEDLNSGLDIHHTLINAVNEGMKMDSAVGEAVRLRPGAAGDIVRAAFLLLPVLPPEACPGLPFRKNHEFTRNRSACGLLIQQAAIDAGADPDIVASAAASANYGALNSPGSPPAGPSGRGGAVSKF